MPLISWMILAATAIDLIFTDPQARWHPVRLVGKWIGFTEKILRRCGADGRMGGIVLVVATLSICGLPVAVGLHFLSSGILNLILGTAILYFSIAMGSLLREGRKVRTALSAGRLPEARTCLFALCGRDVDRLDGPGVTRAAVESLAENSVDGFTAPILYAAVFGPAGAWMYRIANTLDSMVGYKNEKYIRFGWAAARLDDVLNFVPARLTAVLIPMGSLMFRPRFRVRAGLSNMWRFARVHPSPNAGWTEAAVGGVLGLRLGGPAYYFGKWVEKPYLGVADREPLAEDIQSVARLVLFAGVNFALVCCLALWSTGR